MEIQINNIADLKNFILNVSTELENKIKLTMLCLNIVILCSVCTTAELIDIIEQNSKNKYRKIILGKGINPNNVNLLC